MIDDAYDLVLALDLEGGAFKTPAAGRSARPFSVLTSSDDGLKVKTSRGGQVAIRREAFQAAVKVLGDLAPDDPDGWVRISDEVLGAVLTGENLGTACGSYVLPLLEAAGAIELARTRPAKARLPRDPASPPPA